MAASADRGIKLNSIYAIAITLIAHGVVILFLVNLKHIEPAVNNSTIQMIQLKPEKVDAVLTVETPTIHFQSRAIHVDIPNIDFVDQGPADLRLIHSQSDIPYELPGKNSDLYGDVFDPVLRKKLQEAHANRRPARKDAINTWVSGATTMVDVGDGECIRSIPKTDSRERGTQWSMLRVKCGKSDSEKMMDNVTADLEARRHPLKAQ
ncbi:MAG: hypothetical protein ABW044_10565 [Cellvibrio sp.]